MLAIDDENEHLIKTPYIFIFLCHTELYYSDLTGLKNENIIDQKVIKEKNKEQSLLRFP